MCDLFLKPLSIACFSYLSPARLLCTHKSFRVSRYIHNVKQYIHNVKQYIHNVKQYIHNVKQYIHNVKQYIHNVKRYIHNVKQYIHNVKQYIHNVNAATYVYTVACNCRDFAYNVSTLILAPLPL